MSRILKIPFAYFLILFGFGIFGGTPLDGIVNVFMLAVSFAGGLYILFNLRSATRLTQVNYLTYLLLIGCSFVISVVQGFRVWEQSIVDGILAHNRHIFVFSLLLMPHWLLNVRIRMSEISYFLVVMMWVSLLTYTLLNVDLLLNIGLTGFEFQSISGMEYVFDPTLIQRGFIILGCFYYFHKYLQRNELSSIAISLLFFLLPNAFEFQRMQFLMVGATLVYLTVFYSRNSRTYFQLGALAGILLGALALVVIFIDPVQSYFSDIFEFFIYAFQAVFQGESSPDASSSGRVSQFVFIADKLIENFVLGNGLIRGSIQEEITGLDYFHPSDLGLVGAVYAFGLITVPIYLSSFYIHIKTRKMLKGNVNLILRGLFTYEFYLVYQSLASAKIIFNNYQFITVSILICTLIAMQENEPEGSKL